MGRCPVGTAEPRRGDTPIVERRRARVGGSRDRPRPPGITRDRENASDEHDIGARRGGPVLARRCARARAAVSMVEAGGNMPARVRRSPSSARGATRTSGRPSSSRAGSAPPSCVRSAPLRWTTTTTRRRREPGWPRAPSSAARAFRAPPPVHEPLDAFKVRLQVLDPAGLSGASSPAPARRPPRRAPRPGEWARLSHSSCDTKVHSRSGRASHRASRAPCATGASAWASNNRSPTPSTASADGSPPSSPSAVGIRRVRV